MTRAEALAEARRRWGPGGRAWSGYSIAQPHRVQFFVSGPGTATAREGTRWPEGFGDSWEAAFADADRRGKGGAA